MVESLCIHLNIWDEYFWKIFFSSIYWFNFRDECIFLMIDILVYIKRRLGRNSFSAFWNRKKIFWRELYWSTLSTFYLLDTCSQSSWFWQNDLSGTIIWMILEFEIFPKSLIGGKLTWVSLQKLSIWFPVKFPKLGYRNCDSAMKLSKKFWKTYRGVDKQYHACLSQDWDKLKPEPLRNTR